MAMMRVSQEDEPYPAAIRRMMGPGQVDHIVRQALQVCWMLLPDDKRTVDDLEREARRIFDRALRDLREDEKAFRRPSK